MQDPQADHHQVVLSWKREESTSEMLHVMEQVGAVDLVALVAEQRIVEQAAAQEVSPRN
jgi:hypothetical protein